MREGQREGRGGGEWEEMGGGRLMVGWMKGGERTNLSVMTTIH